MTTTHLSRAGFVRSWALWTQYPERCAEVAPGAHVHPGLPPTLLVVGDRDAFTSPEAVTAFATELTDSGNEVTVEGLPFAVHAFTYVDGSIATRTARQLLLDCLQQSWPPSWWTSATASAASRSPPGNRGPEPAEDSAPGRTPTPSTGSRRHRRPAAAVATPARRDTTDPTPVRPAERS